MGYFRTTYQNLIRIRVDTMLKVMRKKMMATMKTKTKMKKTKRTMKMKTKMTMTRTMTMRRTKRKKSTMTMMMKKFKIQTKSVVIFCSTLITIAAIEILMPSLKQLVSSLTLNKFRKFSLNYFSLFIANEKAPVLRHATHAIDETKQALTKMRGASSDKT